MRKEKKKISNIHKLYILSIHAVVGPGAPLISFGLCFILVLHMAASVWCVSVLFKYSILYYLLNSYTLESMI